MYIAIDIGGTKARITSFENESTTSMVEHRDIPVDSLTKYHPSINILTDNIKEIAGDSHVDAIGISMRGDIDSIQGKILDTVLLKDWDGRFIVKDIQKILNCPTRIENDAVCAGISEISLLTTNKYKNYTYIAIGTGIGGTKLTRFSNSILINPWDFGHVIVERNGIECVCGQKGCLEAYVSGWGIEKRYGKKLEDIKDQKPWEEIVEYMGQAITSYLSVNPTESFIFGGGIIFKRPGLVDSIEKISRESSNITNSSELNFPRFELSRYLEHAQSFGALQMVNAGPNLINMNYI